jgi:predicted DNA-binding protein (MmcQ/YjbR family)
VSSRTFAVLTPAGALEFRCTAAASRLLRARSGVAPASGPDDDAGSWVGLPGGVDTIEAEELLDYLRLAYGLAVAGLPEREREPLVQALRQAPPAWQ